MEIKHKDPKINVIQSKLRNNTRKSTPKFPNQANDHKVHKFHECQSKLCIKEEIERRIKKKVEEITLLLIKELKTMILEFRRDDKINIDHIIQETLDDLRVHSN